METAEEKHAEYIPTFQAAVKKGVADPFPYDRLMIHYRKEKEYAKELQVINKAITVFEKQAKKLQTRLMQKTNKKPAIEKLSRAINKSSGLTDNKGKSMIVPEPIAKWMKRKAVVLKKLS